MGGFGCEYPINLLYGLGFDFMNQLLVGINFIKKKLSFFNRI
jgi:hypothetical protein